MPTDTPPDFPAAHYVSANLHHKKMDVDVQSKRTGTVDCSLYRAFLAPPGQAQAKRQAQVPKAKSSTVDMFSSETSDGSKLVAWRNHLQADAHPV
jgi:hypothetical protein